MWFYKVVACMKWYDIAHFTNIPNSYARKGGTSGGGTGIWGRLGLGPNNCFLQKLTEKMRNTLDPFLTWNFFL
jgi:hypothetical protein